MIICSDTERAKESARLLSSRLTIAGLDAGWQVADVSGEPAAPLDDVSLVVVMGGDGTFLKAVHLIDFASIPMLPLNYGTLGFISGDPDRDEVELVADALSGDMVLEHRSTADVDIRKADGSVFHATALNEVAYTRGRSGKMVRYLYGINGDTIADLAADGLIAATPTGSTGYALSAGGPIVSPHYKGLVVVPVAPHAINTRAIVLAPSDVLEVKIETTRAKDACVFIDGEAVEIEDPVSITVRRGEKDVLIARGGNSFFHNVSKVFFGGPFPDMPQT